jgi:hypothetical protein
VRVRIQGIKGELQEIQRGGILFHDFVILYNKKEGQQKVEMEN